MNSNDTADRPQNFSDDRALLCHTLLVARAIRDSHSDARSAPLQPQAGWRATLRNFAAAVSAHRQRREVKRATTLIDSGDLDALEIDARAARAANSAGFGGAEAANDGSYTDAA